jgi:hypothetical protein
MEIVAKRGSLKIEIPHFAFLNDFCVLFNPGIELIRRGKMDPENIRLVLEQAHRTIKNITCCLESGYERLSSSLQVLVALEFE